MRPDHKPFSGIPESFIERSFLSFFLNHASLWATWVNPFKASWHAVLYYRHNRQAVSQRLQQLNQRLTQMEQQIKGVQAFQKAEKLNLNR
jgi:hypothetical protein